MIPLPLSPKKIQEDKNKAIFRIEALYPGYGVTIGNALRRVLLSSFSGAAVTEVKIKGTPHQFSTIPGVLEDTIMILQNLKKLRFKVFEGEVHNVELKVKGEKEVKGGDLKLPSQIKLANPDCHIATLTDKKAELEMEVQIQKGVGYEPVERRIKKKQEIGVIPLDAIYTPITRVNFRVENMRVGERTDFDKLDVEIETDGTITPEEAFKDACKILIDHFNLLVGEKTQKKEIKKGTEGEKGTDKEATKTKIEDLKLSARTISALSANNIKTVGGILRKTEEELLNLEGFGDKGLKEVKKALKKLGLELKS